MTGNGTNPRIRSNGRLLVPELRALRALRASSIVQTDSQH